MTAEIAIANKNGIALAADSKVTVGLVGQEKTFDTVNKLFTLSKIHPVGIMIFGSAEFMQYPWETIAKLYRQQKGGQSEKTIEAWAADFIKYLRRFGKIRTQDKTQNLGIVLGTLFSSIQSEAFAEARRKNIAAASQEWVQLLDTRIQQAIIRLQKAPDILSPQENTAFVTAFGADLGAVVDAYFKSLGNAELIEHAKQFALLAVAKNQFSQNASGIVIAGFGESEYFPAVVSFNTDGYLGDGLKIARDQSMEITRDNPSAILAFAQKEMVQRFMNGIDPSLSRTIPRLFRGSMIQNCFDVLEKYGDPTHKTDEVKKLIRESVNDSIKAIAAPFQKIQMQNFADPIIQMVSLLPKDELPNLAESLVGLTSLKRHVSIDAETVGGPIDVALISKTDGFIWIKRKHYFRPELNPQFVRNYMRGIEPGEDDERSGTPRPHGKTRSGKREAAKSARAKAR